MRIKSLKSTLQALLIAAAFVGGGAQATPASSALSSCVQDRTFLKVDPLDGSSTETALITCNMYESVPGTNGPEPSEISSEAINPFNDWAVSLFRIWSGDIGTSPLSDFVVFFKTGTDPDMGAETAVLYSAGATDFFSIYATALAATDPANLFDATEGPDGVTRFEQVPFTDSPNGENGWDWLIVHSNVPEPGSLALFGLALAGVAAARKRKPA